MRKHDPDQQAAVRAVGGRLADDQTLAAALLDRLRHHGLIAQITGESYRPRVKRRAEQSIAGVTKASS